jgi:hypothetical protein
MKKTHFCFVLAFLLMTSLSWAQNAAYTFKVLVSKGKAEIKSGSSWSTLKVGTALKETDEVKIADNSYLGLIHSNGRPLELKEPGSYRVADLAKNMSKGQSVMSKYTDFILSSTDTKRSRLAATGAVHRGTKDGIELYLPEPKKDKVFGDRVVLNWTAAHDTKGYIVIVRNLFEEELGRFETTATSFELDLNSEKLRPESDLLVKVLSQSNPTHASKEYALHRVNSKEREEVSKALEELGPAASEESALNKFILAGFYEEKYLLIDAITAYQDAIRLAPDVAQYKEAYQDFLKRIGFEKK